MKKAQALKKAYDNKVTAGSDALFVPRTQIPAET
jgi:hypothetical protein